MDPIVIGRGYVDNYLMSFASDPTKNAFSVDVTDGGMFSILSWWLVNSIHLCDKEKHKAKQNTKDSDYNVFYYRRRYNIEVSTTIHALKYHLCIYIFMLDEVYSCGQPQSIWFPTTWCRRKEESFLIFFPHCILSLCVVFPFAFALSFSFGFHHFFVLFINQTT